MKIIIKALYRQQISVLVLLFFLITLQGCSFSGRGSYSCSSIDNWVNETKTLTKMSIGQADPNRLTTQQIALTSYPLFSDDKYIPTFGKSYFAMSESERQGIYHSLLKCFNYPYVRYGLAIPFLPDSKRTGTAAVWNRYLAAAKQTTYQAEVVKRSQLVAAAQKRQQQRIEQQRKLKQLKKQRAEAEKKRQKDMRNYIANFNTEVVNGPFDSIEGGSFFNALYKGDAASIRRQNADYSQLKILQYKQFMGASHPTDDYVDMLYKHVRLLDSVKAIYLFQYQGKYARCLREDAVKFKLVETVPDVVYENLLGIEVARHYGSTTTTFYKVNKDFQATFRRIGKTKPENLSMAFVDLLIGGGGINIPAELANADPMFNQMAKLLKGKGPRDLRNQLATGTKQMMKNFSCDSPEIKQLEKNMLKIQ